MEERIYLNREQVLNYKKTFYNCVFNRKYKPFGFVFYFFFSDDEDDFGAFDDHRRLWTLFTDTGKQVLYHFVELRLPPTQDGTYSLRKFLDKHRNIFHQPCCLCFQQISEDGPSGETKTTNCFPEYFDKTNVSVEDCPLNDLISYLMKAGKCNETEKNWFETIMQTIQAQTSWDDLENIKYLA